MREGHIYDLLQREPEEAAKQFAPRVLKVVPTQTDRNLEEELQAVCDEVHRNPKEFPILVWTMFDADSKPLPEEERINFDLSSSSKLKHLPHLADGLHELYRAVERVAAPVNGDQIVSGFLDRMQASKDFEAAWEACRDVGNYECQGNVDLGEVRNLTVKNLLVMRNGQDVSFAGLLLRKLVDVHNRQLKDLLGTDPEKTPIHTMDPQEIRKHLLPWADARMRLLKIFPELLPAGEPSAKAARAAELFLREWLKTEFVGFGFSLPNHVWNVKDKMPSFQQVPDGMVLISSENQAAALPPECRKEIDDFFQDNGPLPDRVHLALEFLKKVSLWVECTEQVAETLSLKAVMSSFCSRPPQKPSLLDVFERNHRLSIKHVNVLQRYLSNLVEANPEDELDSKYKVRLSDDQLKTLSRLESSPNSKQAGLLMRKLVTFAGKLRQNQFPEKEGVYNRESEPSQCVFNHAHNVASWLF